MPDVLFHISFALLLAVLLKIKNWKLVITGAFLPDFSRVILIILNFLKFDELKSFVFLEPMHSPFINIFLALSIALIFSNPIKNFLLIYLGALTHYFLDFLQFAGKFGQTFFYPFYFKQYSLNLFYTGNYLFLFLGVLMLTISVYYLKERNYFKINKKTIPFSAVFILIVFLILYLTTNKIIDNNIHGTKFILNPNEFNNKEISLYNTKVISLGPYKINELGKVFIIESKEDLKLNSLITIEGIYKENKIIVSSIFHNNNKKYYFSVIGLIAYIILIFKKD